jgi:hypothetical protein
MSKYRDERSDRLKMIDMMTKSLDCLIQNPFGNYAIQHALEIFFDRSNNEFQQMIDRILLKVVFYSNHKFSSNVVEKCILCTNKVKKNNFSFITSNHVNKLRGKSTFLGKQKKIYFRNNQRSNDY